MQQRVLVRARNLATFRRALAERATAGSALDACGRAIVVPTRAAAELLREAIERRAIDSGRPGFICPDLITRDEWHERLHGSLADGRRWMSRLERELVLERAARHVLASRRFSEPPFHLRPGLVAAMLDFYDELRRRQRTVRRLARVLFDELRVERGTDRGSESLIEQSRFLGLTFLAYDRQVAASGAVDEHGLRASLLGGTGRSPATHLIVAVADHPADPKGLWPADFDLLGRLAGLERVEIVVTDEAHDAGFRERIEQELPGIAEVREADVPWSPRLEVAAGASGTVFVSRDREEELRDVVRVLAARAKVSDEPLPSTAVVFHRPLPYLYLAQQVMADVDVPYRAFDALPLAAEPFTSLVDLLLGVVRNEASGASVLAVAASPLTAIDLGDGTRAVAADAAAIRDLLGDRASEIGARSLARAVVEALATARGRSKRLADAAGRAARAAVVLADFADACGRAPSGSAAVAELAAFLRAHAPVTGAPGGLDERARRARAAVLAVLDELAAQLARHDGPGRTADAVAALVRHALEAHTVAPERPRAGGLYLVDAIAARFGEFEDVFLVGLVETDWSSRPRRNVFFPATLLASLGWPQDVERVRAQQAAFRDVLMLARGRIRLSAFELDGDTLVGPSTLINAADELSRVEIAPPPRRPLFPDERLLVVDRLDCVPPAMRPWLVGRAGRPALTTPAYAGQVAPRPAGVYRVSRVDRYVTCPFKYLAEDVLQLVEERRSAPGLDPLERGSLLHAIFEDFYGRWQASGRGAITAANVSDAEVVFREAVERAIAPLPDVDQVIERLRLLGSIVAPGVADRVFDLEIAAGRTVKDRLIEVTLAGQFRFPFRHGLGETTITIRGKADRIDVLDDGSLAVVDYKLGRMPDLGTSVQIGVYAHCARQQLEAADGRAHPVAAAAYLAFGDERNLEGRLGKTPAETDAEVTIRAAAFATAVEQIEAGQFPPRPVKPGECQWCGYAAVCRKEYRLEDADDAAESV